MSTVLLGLAAWTLVAFGAAPMIGMFLAAAAGSQGREPDEDEGWSR